MRSLFFLIIFAVSSPAFSQFKCWDKIEDEKQNLEEVLQKQKDGQANPVDVLSAKLKVNQQASDCGLVVKYNYCYTQQTLLKSMLAVFDKHSEYETPLLNVSGTEQKLKEVEKFCLTASKTHPATPDESIGQPSQPNP